MTEASQNSGKNNGVDDAELWHSVTASVKPYRPKKTTQKSEKPKPQVTKTKPVLNTAPPVLTKTPDKKIDAGVSEQLKRKKFPVDAKIDLHGMTEKNAYQKLITFVTRCLAQEKRTILIITGKGAGGQGVLKKNAPLWLETEFADQLLGLSEAPIDMGGSGAFLARFRKR